MKQKYVLLSLLTIQILLQKVISTDKVIIPKSSNTIKIAFGSAYTLTNNIHKPIDSILDYDPDIFIWLGIV